MSSSSNVTVTLTARDLITPTLARLRGGFGELGSFANGALTGITTAVATQAIDTLIGSVQKLKQTLGEAMEFQTRTIGSVNSLAAVSGLPFRQASDLVDELNIQMANLAKDLPGEAQDFINTANMISPAFSDAFGKITQQNMGQFKDKLVELSKVYTLLGQQSGVISTDMTGEFVRRFLSGTSSLPELRLLDFGTKNPAFLKLVKQELQNMGKDEDDFKKLTNEQRYQILQKVGSRLLDPEAIKALQNSASGILASMKDGLFSPVIGVFGVLRKVVSEGDRSVMDSISGLLKTVTVLSGTWSELAKKLGLTTDPMAAVIRSVDWVNDKLVELNNLFRGILEGDPMASFDMSEFISQSFRGLLDGVRGIVDGIQWRQVGQFLGHALVSNVTSLIRFVFDPRNLGAVLSLASQLVSALFNVLVGTLEGIFRAAWDGISSTLDSIVQWFKDIFTKITSFNPLEAVREKVTSINPGGIFQDAIRDVGAGVKQLGGAIMAPLSKPDTVQPEAKPMSSTSNNYQVTVAATTGASPEEIARTVMAAISGGYTSYRSNSLTA